MTDNSNSSSPKSVRPFGVSLIAIINALAALLTVLFWVLGFIRLPNPATLAAGPDRMNAAATYGFGIADFIWSLPLLLIAAVGLWKLRTGGWLAAQMANALWWYSLTVLVVRDLYMHTISPGNVIFLPFTFFSFWAAVYLWRKRRLFWKEEVSTLRQETALKID